MKKEILNLGTALTKKQLQTINGGATCIKVCDNASGQQLTCGEGTSCGTNANGCWSRDDDGRYYHEVCNNEPIPLDELPSVAPPL